MVAKQKILPGDVLIVDTPFITSLFEEYQETHCYYCFKRLPESSAVSSPTYEKVYFFILKENNPMLNPNFIIG